MGANSSERPVHRKISKICISQVGANSSERPLEHAQMGANSSERHFSLFNFCGSSLGSLGTLLELLWVPLGVSLGASGAPWGLFGDPWGLRWAHFAGPWAPLATIWVHFGSIFDEFGYPWGLDCHFGMVLADLG